MKPKKKQYSKLPFKFIEAIQLFTRAEIIIYSILCVRANKDKRTWPGVKSLMRDAGVTKPTVTTALKKLRKYGFLELVSRRYHNTSVYRITEPEDMSSLFEELDRRGASHFEWQHDYKDNEKSKSNGIGHDSDEESNQEVVKVKSSENKSKAEQVSKINSAEVNVWSDVAVTTLTRTTVNKSTLKDSLGTFEEKPVSDNRLGKDSSLISSKAEALVPKDGDIQEDSQNGNSLNEDESSSTHPVSRSAISGAKGILKSSVPINIHRPMESDEDTSGTDNLTDEGENMTSTIKHSPRLTRKQTEKRFRDLLKARSTQDEWKAFLQFEKTLPHGRVTAAIEVGFNILDQSVSDVLATLEGMSAND